MVDRVVVVDLGDRVVVRPLPADTGLALKAGLLRARHYHRTTRAVSLADCVAAEIAQSMGSLLTTADPHLTAPCRDEVIGSIPLPDSSGQAWSP